MSKYSVSIIQNDCTSCGLCAEVEPKIFFIHQDGLAYVKPEGTNEPNTPDYIELMGMVAVSDSILESVIECAEECPGECIYIHNTNELLDA